MLSTLDDATDLFSEGVLEGDDQNLLFANTPSQSDCAAIDAEDFTLKTRDDESCSLSTPLSPESVQLFEDPTTLLNNLLPPSTEGDQGPSGSGKPPNPSDRSMFPGDLFNEDGAKTSTDDLIQWSLQAPGLRFEAEFYCRTGLRPVAVCCDGPVGRRNKWENCDRREQFDQQNLVPLDLDSSISTSDMANGLLS